MVLVPASTFAGRAGNVGLLQRLVAFCFVGALALAGLLVSPAPAWAKDPPNPTVKSLNVKPDQKAFLAVVNSLPAKIGSFYLDRFNTDDPNCRAAAVLVAAQAVDNVTYRENLINFVDQTARGIALGATLGGAAKVAKIADIFSAIVQAFDTDDPYGALGELLTNEGVDLASNQIPASGSDTVDDAKKQIAEAVKDKIINAFFPGVTKNLPTFTTTVGNCDVTVTLDFSWMSVGEKRGIRIFIDGDCHCKSLVVQDRLLGRLAPNFHGLSSDVKNCGLGQFKLIAFLKLERVEADVTFGGHAIDLKKLVKTIADLRKALAGEDDKLDPKQLADDLQKQIGKATTVTADAVIRPVFAKTLTLEEFWAKCNNCSETATTAPPPGPLTTPAPAPIPPVGGEVKPPLVERICQASCKAQADAVDSAAQAKADLANRRSLIEQQRQLLQNQVQAAQAQLDAINQQIAGTQKASDHQTLVGLQQQAAAKETALDNLKTRLQQAQQQEAQVNADYYQALARWEATMLAYEDCIAKCRQKAATFEPKDSHAEATPANPAQQTQYYCDNPAGYYPTVPTCSTAWHPVATTPTPDQAQQYWYYCANPAGYYPSVAQCSTAWQPVPAATMPGTTPAAPAPDTAAIPFPFPFPNIGIGIGLGGRGGRGDHGRDSDQTRRDAPPATTPRQD